jgi:hypothetical protein
MRNATSPVTRPRQTASQTIETATFLAQRTTLPNRNLILDTAIRLYDSAPAGSLAGLVAERLRMPKPQVEAVLVMWLLQYRSESNAMRVGIANAIQIAQTAARDAWGVQ